MTAPRWVASLAIAAALVGSAALVASAPDNYELTTPFLSRGVMGETVSGRNLTAVVESVTLTKYLDVKYDEVGDTSTKGVWVVVDTVLTARLDTLNLSYAEIQIDDVHYRVSDILPNPSPLSLNYGAGIPQRGSLVFEIPREALESPGAAQASIAFFHTIDRRLDSVPVVVVNLAGLDISARQRIDETSVVNR